MSDKRVVLVAKRMWTQVRMPQQPSRYGAEIIGLAMNCAEDLRPFLLDIFLNEPPFTFDERISVVNQEVKNRFHSETPLVNLVLGVATCFATHYAIKYTDELTPWEVMEYSVLGLQAFSAGLLQICHDDRMHVYNHEFRHGSVQKDWSGILTGAISTVRCIWALNQSGANVKVHFPVPEFDGRYKVDLLCTGRTESGEEIWVPIQVKSKNYSAFSILNGEEMGVNRLEFLDGVEKLRNGPFRGRSIVPVYCTVRSNDIENGLVERSFLQEKALDLCIALNFT